MLICSLLTILLQSVVHELRCGPKERLQVEQRMVCSFHTVVFHPQVTVEPLTRVDPVPSRGSVQHVGHAQRRQLGLVSRH